MTSEHLEKLKLQIIEHTPRLQGLSDEPMQKTLRPGKWSGKEILGHLTDSAAMNRQRMVRSQYEALYDFPGYDQAKWVQIQSYNTYVWKNLVALWTFRISTSYPYARTSSRHKCI